MTITSHPASSRDISGGAASAKNLILSLSLLLTASGAVSLVFQMLWIRQLGTVVGVDVEAVSLAVAAFFCGLAAGSFLIGKLTERSEMPLRLYAALELGTAVLGLLATLVLANYAAPFAELHARSAALAWISVFLIVGLPAVMMGGTLPALARSLSSATANVPKGTGTLYAANTLGALLGCLGASFVLIPALGVRGTAVAAAATGMTAATAALFLGRGAAVQTTASTTRGRTPAPAWMAMCLYGAAGAVALGYEVVWSQTVVQFTSTRSFAFSVTLATYLAGIALGSFTWSRASSKLGDAWAAFGFLVGSAGLVAIVQVSMLGPWLPALQTFAERIVLDVTGSHLAGMCARFGVAAASVVLGPTLLLGAAFPAALRLIADPDHSGRDVGAAVAVNTAGGVLGTLATGFVLVPQLGLVRSMAVLATVSGVICLACLRRSRRSTGTTIAMMAIPAAAVVCSVAVPVDHLARLLPGARGGMLLSYEEAKGGTVAVVEEGDRAHRFRRLYVQGVSNSGDAMPSLRYMRLQALLPLLIHNAEPRSALVIGLGTGITAGALLSYPGLERRVVAELLPAVRRSAHLFGGNFDAAANRSLDIRLRDGRRELLTSDETYDLVTLESPPPSAAGVANLYSTDFYVLAKTRLNARGIVAQWLPLPTQNDNDTRSLVRSFLDAFPHASLWSTELHEMLLVGSMAPIELDARRINERFRQPSVEAALAEIGIASPDALMATWITDRPGLESFAADAPAVTDDRPRIEYADWVRSDEIQRVLPELIGLRTDAPLLHADADFRKATAVERQRLLVFYQASLNAYAGNRDLWMRDMARVMVGGGDNPYYRWFSGGGGG